jgi:hypothetical protein
MQYARSTSRGKETSMNKASQLSSLLGRPLTMAGRNNQVNGSASSGIVGASNGLPMNAFHPRPANLRVK